MTNEIHLILTFKLKKETTDQFMESYNKTKTVLDKFDGCKQFILLKTQLFQSQEAIMTHREFEEVKEFTTVFAKTRVDYSILFKQCTTI
eukprot:gene4028-7284_t